MPERKILFANGEFYHIYNRGVDRRITFDKKGEYSRAQLTSDFYRFTDTGVSLSRFIELDIERQNELKIQATKSGLLVGILAYCLMPNHFHFLLKQNKDGGIAKFMAKFQNSYTRYFNLRNKRTGPLFSTQFKAVRIKTEEQLTHVSRYIHLNPYTSYIVRSLNELKNYDWSSLREYLSPEYRGICSIEEILDFFVDKDDYWNFIVDQANYQRELKRIEHLLLEQ